MYGFKDIVSCDFDFQFLKNFITIGFRRQRNPGVAKVLGHHNHLENFQKFPISRANQANFKKTTFSHLLIKI